VKIQSVKLTDLNGFTFQAFYQMEQQNSGEWRIGGCKIQQSDLASSFISQWWNEKRKTKERYIFGAVW
jgi:hypothetical protein